MKNLKFNILLALSLMVFLGHAQTEAYSADSANTSKPEVADESSQIDKSYAFKNGFAVNLLVGFQPLTFGLPYGSDDIANDFDTPLMQGLKIGNRWYFYNNKLLGVGLSVNWLEYLIGAVKYNNTTRVDMTISAIELGPVFSLAINPKLAIDAYYNAKPTLSISSFSTSGSAYIGVGVSQAIGGAIRWKLLNLGAEYTLGSLKSVGADGTLDKISVNGFRILVGLKF